MVLVQVELASNVQVRDVISFLLSRSYNNFRVTDQESLAPGYVPANVPGLSQSSSERFVQSPLMQDTDSAQNAFTRPESRHEKPLSDTTGISAPYQLDRLDQKSTAQDLKARVVLPNVNCFPHSESTELMAEEDTNENDLSLDVPSESRNVLMTENAQARSDEGSREVSSSSFNITWLRHVVRLLKKKGILKCSAKCAVCEMNIMVSPRSLISHINNRHTKYPLYGCSICHLNNHNKQNIIKHIRTHTGVAKSIEAVLIKLPISPEQQKKMEEMLEICFGVTFF